MKNHENFCEEFQRLFSAMVALCAKHGERNPFIGGHAIEIYIATVLGHTLAPDLSGPDAYNGKIPVEYKSSSGKSFKVKYSSIGVMDTWENQMNSLREKISSCPEHYHARFDGSSLVEIWKLDSESVYDLLIPKIYTSWMNTSIRSRPNIEATIGKNEIQKNGELVWSNNGMLVGL